MVFDAGGSCVDCVGCPLLWVSGDDHGFSAALPLPNSAQRSEDIIYRVVRHGMLVGTWGVVVEKSVFECLVQKLAWVDIGG